VSFNALSPSKWSTHAGKGFGGRIKNFGSNMLRIGSSFCRNLKESTKELYNGPAGASGFKKHAGKVLLGLALASSILGATNAIIGAKKSAKQQKNSTIDKTKTYTVL